MEKMFSLFEHSSMAYIYHRIILDDKGTPCDYEFLNSNESAQKMLGKTKSELEGKRILSLFPETKNDPFDWIAYYGKLALEGGHDEFEQFSRALGRYYKVYAISTEKYYFHTIFVDISDQVREKNELRKVISVSENFLAADIHSIDYQSISDIMTELCEAKYGVFHVYNADRTKFIAKAVSGAPESILKAGKILGFDLLKKEWDYDPQRDSLTKHSIITRFESLHELNGGVLPKVVIDGVQTLLGIKETVVINIKKGDVIIGDFVILMQEGKNFQNYDLIELYVRQIGMLISRTDTEEILYQRLKLEEALSQISSSFVNVETEHIDELIHTALARIGKIADADHSFFFRFSPELECFDVPYEWTALGLDPHIEGLKCSEESVYLWWQQQFISGNTVKLNKLDDLPAEAEEEKELLRKLNIKSFVSIPIVSSQTMSGFIGFDTTTHEKHWNDLDIRMLKTTGEIILGAVERVVGHRHLMESEEKYRLIAENSSDVIWIMNVTTLKHEYISPTVLQLRGFTPEEALQHRLEDILTPKDCEFMQSLLAQEIPLYLQDPTQIKDFRLELQHYHKDGSLIWCEISARPNVNSLGEIEIVGVTRNIEERKRLQAQLQRKSEDQQILLDNIPTQIWYLTDETTYGSVNQALADFNGKTKAELEHHNICEFLPDHIARSAVQNNRAVFSTGEPIHTEEWSLHHTGEQRLLSIWKIPKVGADGAIEYVVCSAEDVTDIHNAQKETLIAKEKAEESNRLKTAFLASMNHELRTPLNHIMGFSQILDSTSDMGEVKECATHIYKSGETLLKMIQDIFDLALAEQAIMRPKRQNVKCFDHFFDNKASLEDIFESAGRQDKVKLVFSPDLKALHSSIYIDVSKVNQVLSNLFRNAVKFTYEGKIEFGFTLLENDSIRYFVKDTGIGVAPEKQELIFDFFRQVDEGGSSIYGGVGIGLAISKKITEVMNGKLSIESAPDQGSSFYLDIPVQRHEYEIVENADYRAGNIPNFSAFSIMVVEDDEASLMITRNLLKKSGAKILEARNGREAIDIMESYQNVDAILMDIRMPIMDGFQATKAIKHKFHSLPILALSAHVKVGPDFDTRYNRFDAVITKPINGDIIFMELSKVLLK